MADSPQTQASLLLRIRAATTRDFNINFTRFKIDDVSLCAE